MWEGAEGGWRGLQGVKWGVIWGGSAGGGRQARLGPGPQVQGPGGPGDGLGRVFFPIAVFYAIVSFCVARIWHAQRALKAAAFVPVLR